MATSRSSGFEFGTIYRPKTLYDIKRAPCARRSLSGLVRYIVGAFGARIAAMKLPRRASRHVKATGRQRSFRYCAYVGALPLMFFAVACFAQRTKFDNLDGKMIFGFQGWFACPNDENAIGAWNHWFSGNRVSPETTTVDLLPDVSELTVRERCETGWVDRDGAPIDVFSDQRYAPVLRQFRW